MNSSQVSDVDATVDEASGQGRQLGRDVENAEEGKVRINEGDAW